MQSQINAGILPRMTAILAKRVQARLDQLGLSARKASLNAGLHPDAVRNILRGKSESPRGQTVTALAYALKCTTAYLLGETDDPNDPGPADQHVANSPDHPPITNLPTEYVPVEKLSVRPGMGGGGIEIEHDDVERIYFPPEMIKLLRALPSNLRALQVEGPSMSPILESGDTVLVDTSKRNPSQPAIFALWDGFGVVCKWVERVANSDPPRIRIISENPRFQPYEAVDGEEAYILGRVVWFARQI